MRNQVGALVGALIYVYVVEPLVGALFTLSARHRRHHAPLQPRRGRQRAVAILDAASDQVLNQVPAGLLLLLYTAIFVVAGLLVMQRRDITA